MTEEEIRLECLRMATCKVNIMASGSYVEPKDVPNDIELAQKYYDFVCGKESK